MGRQRRTRLTIDNLCSSTVANPDTTFKSIETWLDSTAGSREKRKRASSQPTDCEGQVVERSKRRRRSFGDLRSEQIARMPGDEKHDPERLSGGGDDKAPFPRTPQSKLLDDHTTPLTSTTSKIPDDPTWDGQRLSAQGLKKEDAWKHHPTFRSKILSILEGARFSEMKQWSKDHLRSQYDIYNGMSEDDFLNAMIPLVVKGSRLVSRPKTFGEAMKHDPHPVVTEPREGVDYLAALWSDDGVFVRVNANLDGDLLPDVYKENKLNKGQEKADDDMTTPRPDRIFGLDPNLLPIPDPLLLDKRIAATLQVCKFMHFPFFLVEGKGNRGNPHGASNQARRGGATVVNALRSVYACIDKQGRALGPDYDTFMFSATISVETVNVWLHWAEVKEEAVLFHMDLVHTMAFTIESTYSDTRKIINKIFCWGCDLRARRLIELHEDMIQWQKVKSGKVEPGQVLGDYKAPGGETKPKGSSNQETKTGKPAPTKSTPDKPAPKR